MMMNIEEKRTFEFQRKIVSMKQSKVQVIATKCLQHKCIEHEQYLLSNWTFYNQ